MKIFLHSGAGTGRLAGRSPQAQVSGWGRAGRWLLGAATILGLATAQDTKAQTVASYGFAPAAGTYTAITGGTVLGSATSDDQQFNNVAASSTTGVTGTGLGPGFPIGFNFVFRGQTYNRFAINNNGWITLGNGTGSNNVVRALFGTGSGSNYYPINNASTPTQDNVIGGLTVDMIGQTGSELRFQTLGTGTSHTLVVQWKNYRRYNPTALTGDALNFQIRLNETTNTIDVVYGTMTVDATLDSTPPQVQVGLRGTTSADFKILKNTTNWTTPTLGTANSDVMLLSSTIKPVSGQTYTFTTPVANDVLVATVQTLGKLPQTYGVVPHVVKAAVRNNGTAAQTNVAVTLTVTQGATTVLTNTQTVATLAVGGTSTVTFAGYTPATAGDYVLTVSVPSDGDNTNNQLVYTQTLGTALGYVDATQALNAGSVGVGAASSYLAARYTLAQAAAITSITPTFVGAGTAGTTYKLAIFDASGTGGTPGATPIYLSAVRNRPGATGADPLTGLAISLPAGDFFVAIAELDNNVALGYQIEDPLRTNTFYFKSGAAGAWTGVETTALRTRLALDVTVAAPPSCTNVTGLAAGSISLTGATLSFTGPANAADYSVSYTPQGGSATTVSPNPAAPATSATLTGLTPLTTYSASVTTNCTGANGSSTAATISFIATPYCTTGLHTVACSAADRINAVSIVGTGFSNSNAACANTGQLGYSAYPPTVTTTATLSRTLPYTISVTSTGNSIISAWVDFNQNGTFEASEYTLITASSTAGTAATATISVPAGAVLGQTGLRVRTRLASNANGPTDACTGFGSGETEDYVVTIGAAPACSPASGFALASATGTTASISFTDGNGAQSYTATYTPQGATAVAISPNPTASPISLMGLTPGTSYTLSVTTNCVAGATAGPSTFAFSTPIANDDCAGAITLAPSATCTTTSGTVLGATQSLAPIACGGFTATAPVADVWYKFTATSVQHTISIVGGFDGVLEVRTGTCAASTNFACSDAVSNNETLAITTVIGTTYLIRYYPFVANPATPTFTICVTQPTDLVVSNTQNISGSYNNVTITGPATGGAGVATMTAATAVYGTLTVQDGGTLNTANFQITGSGNFDLQAGGTLSTVAVNGIDASSTTSGAIRSSGTRTFSNDANYIYTGANANQVTGSGLPGIVRSLTVNNSNATPANRILTLTNPLAVRQLLRLQAGNLVTGGKTFTLLSVIGQGTALIDNTGGVVVGTGTMQRAVDITTDDNIGYHHYSSPVVTTPINDLQTPGFDFVLNPAFNTATLSGQTRPYPTVFGYDEARLATSPATDLNAFDKGFFSPTSGDAMGVGKGYTASVPNALTVDFVGTFNNGNVNITGLTRGASADAGWQLLGNPYPSAIDWSTVGAGQRTNLDASAYVYHATSRYSGFYTTYLGSLVTNGINGQTLPILDAGAGFFTRVSAGQTSGALALTNTNRLTSFANQPSFGRQAGVRAQLQLQVRGAGSTDALTLYTDAAATTGLDAEYDATKLTNPNGLNLAALAGSTKLAIDGRPLPTATTVVPLSLGVPAAGTYALSVAQLANFGSTAVYLRDAVAGTEQLLMSGTTVNVTLTNVATATTRFSLVFRPSGALATAAALTASQVSLYPNPAHGSFALLLPPVAGQKELRATLLNALGQTVQTRTIALTAAGASAEFSTAALAQGVYVLRLQAGSELLTQRVVVE